MRLPMQPLVRDEQGVPRFQKNRLVRYLLDAGGIDLNQLSIFAQAAEVTKQERMQLAQLIGYSVDGFADLSYSTPAMIRKADEAASKLRKRRKK